MDQWPHCFPQKLIDVKCAVTSGLELETQDDDDAELSIEVENMIEWYEDGVYDGTELWGNISYKYSGAKYCLFC